MTVRGSRGQTARDGVPHAKGHLRVGRSLAESHAGLGGKGCDVRGGERTVAVESLVERDAKAELIGADVDPLPPHLFRRHVRRCSRRDPGAGELPRRRAGVRPRPQRVVADPRARPREAEVGHQDTPVVTDQDVLRLEVAVNESRVVRGCEPATGGNEDSTDDLAESPSPRCEPLRERRPIDELHGEKDAVVERPDVVHGDDVGVGEPGHGLRFAQKTTTTVGVVRRAVRQEELDRDRAVELRIVCGVDDAGGAAAEHVAYLVAPHVRSRRPRIALEERPPELRQQAPALSARVDVGLDGTCLALVEFSLHEEQRRLLGQTSHLA